MFCFQCEQTSKGTGCNTFAVCGKDDDTAILQDLLVHTAKGIAPYVHRAHRLGARDRVIDRYLLEALFITVTNVNFDAPAIEKVIRRGIAVRYAARNLYEGAAANAGQTPETLRGPVTWTPEETFSDLVKQGAAVSVLTRRDQFGPDISGLQELLLYGIKGAAAYADHALIFGQESDEVYACFAEALSYLAEEEPSVDGLFALTLLFLGIKNIRLGPTLPAFITPTVLGVLVEKFNLMPIDTPEKDLAAILGRAA